MSKMNFHVKIILWSPDFVLLLDELIEKGFYGTSSLIGGISSNNYKRNLEIQQSKLLNETTKLDDGGEYAFRLMVKSTHGHLQRLQIYKV